MKKKYYINPFGFFSYVSETDSPIEQLRTEDVLKLAKENGFKNLSEFYEHFRNNGGQGGYELNVPADHVSDS